MSSGPPPAIATPSAGVKPAAHIDLVGRRLGDYAILRWLGQGAMADVYLAEQVSLRRSVALKVLKNDRAADETYVRRFKREAQAAAGLIHGNIVQIYEVGQTDGVHFIAQEYVPGQNLRQLLQRHGPPEVSLAVALMRQVAAALHKASEQGIVHRDIKPDNIMVTKDGQVKVADFGLARMLDDRAGLALTQEGVTLGTPLYMSPEQVEGKPLDPRSDIYSFGVTCYHLLAGHPPFEADSPLAVAVQHIKAPPPRLENERPDLPGGLCRIVHKMLAKEPGERFHTPAELLRDLRALPIATDDEEWLRQLDEWSVTETTAIRNSRTELVSRLDTLMKTSALAIPRRRVGRWAAAAIAALVLGAAVGWSMRPPSLLDQPAAPSKIERQPNAKEQYEFAWALWLEDPKQAEAAWRAVVEYFRDSPENKLSIQRAEQQLARLYLRQERNDEARRVFEKFAKLDEGEEREFRAFGVAGLCLLAAQAGDVGEVGKRLGELVRLWHEMLTRKPPEGPLTMLDEEMRRRLQETLPPMLRNSEAPEAMEVLRRWEEMFARKPPEAKTPPGPPG